MGRISLKRFCYKINNTETTSSDSLSMYESENQDLTSVSRGVIPKTKKALWLLVVCLMLFCLRGHDTIISEPFVERKLYEAITSCAF